jgi:hypothetical protein
VLLARVNELDALVAAWAGAGRRRQDQATRSRSMGALRARLGRAGGRPNQHGGRRVRSYRIYSPPTQLCSSSRIWIE